MLLSSKGVPSNFFSDRSILTFESKVIQLKMCLFIIKIMYTITLMLYVSFKDESRKWILNLRFENFVVWRAIKCSKMWIMYLLLGFKFFLLIKFNFTFLPYRFSTAISIFLLKLFMSKNKIIICVPGRYLVLFRKRHKFKTIPI